MKQNAYTISAQLIEEARPFWVVNEMGQRRLFTPGSVAFNRDCIWWFISEDMLRYKHNPRIEVA